MDVPFAYGDGGRGRFASACYVRGSSDSRARGPVLWFNAAATD